MFNKFLLLVGGIFVLMSACKEKQVEEAPESFRVVKPIVKDTFYINEYVAEIQAINYAEVRTRVKGYIEKIHVDEGQQVKTGELLFSINSKEYEQELQRASAVVKSAEADLKAMELEMLNTKRLFEKNIVSKAEFDLVSAKVDALRANVESAEASKEQAALNLSFSRIRAPYSGVINRIPKKIGSLVEEGDMLTTISDTREVYAYFNLTESDYLKYISDTLDKESNVIRLMLANNQPYPLDGKVEIIESEFDNNTGNIAIRAKFPNPDGILKHGSNGKIIVKRKLANAMMVHQKSTFEVQDQLYVYIMNADSTLTQRNIKHLMRFPDYFVVATGLKGDEWILFEGVQKVKAGKKIAPDFKSLQ
jgi:membrane fusion protein (multidrug efflux system)